MQEIVAVEDDADFTIIRTTVGNKELLDAQCNKDFSAIASHSLLKRGIELGWTGPYTVVYDCKKL